MSEEKVETTETQSQDEGKQAELDAQELQAKLEQAEKEKALLKEDLDRERRVNELLDGVDEIKEPSYQESTFLGDGYEEIDKRINEKIQQTQQQIWQQMQQVSQNTYAQYQAMSKIEQMYYSKYPQHKGWEDVVNRESANLAKELGDRVNAVPFDSKLEQVAKRVNSEIGKMKERLSNPTLPIEGGNMSEPEVQQTKTEEGPKSEEERLQSAFADISSMRQNKSLRR